MNQVVQFLNELKTNPKAKELLEKLDTPKTDVEFVEGYISIANDLGYSLTQDELLKVLGTLTREQCARTEAAEKATLNEEDLDSVAGGAPGDHYDRICDDSFNEGEWCWFSDYCSVLITNYDEDIKAVQEGAQACMSGFNNPIVFVDVD